MIEEIGATVQAGILLSIIIIFFHDFYRSQISRSHRGSNPSYTTFEIKLYNFYSLEHFFQKNRSSINFTFRNIY